MSLIIPARQPPKLDPRVDFDPEEARKLIHTHGMRISWEMAAACPCVRVHTIGGYTGQTQEARHDCEVCGGSGIAYHSNQGILGIVAQTHLIPDRHKVWGEIAKWMTTITVLHEHVPSFLDRYSLLDNVLIYREVKERTAQTVEALTYPVYQRTLELGAGPGLTGCTEIERGVLHMLRADAAGLVDPTPLVEGTDFEVTAAGAIDWTLGDGLGNSPAQGERYAAQYYCHPRFVVWTLPYAFRDTWVKTKTPGAQFQHMIVTVDCLGEFFGGRD